MDIIKCEGDKQNGAYREWCKDRLMLDCYYLNRVLDGMYTKYHGNGNKKIECLYFRGELHGGFYEWNSEGVLITQSHYFHGEECSEEDYKKRT